MHSKAHVSLAVYINVRPLPLLITPSSRHSVQRRRWQLWSHENLGHWDTAHCRRSYGAPCGAWPDDRSERTAWCRARKDRA